MAEQSTPPLSPEARILQLRSEEPLRRFGGPLVFFGVVDAIVIGIVVCNVPFPPLAILLVASTLAMSGFFVNCLWTDPIHFDCPHCGGLISNLVEWACGYCRKVHPRPDYGWVGSFLGQCAKCGSSPKAYRCVHCGATIRLQLGGDLARHAYTPNRPAPKEPQPAEPAPPAAVEESPIAKMLRPIQDRQQRREALMQYERQTRREIQDRKDLSDLEKEELLNELAMDIEQARMMDDG